jgi:hypothetical protein
LTAVPAPGSIFFGWRTGPCTGTGLCIVTMTTDQTPVAHFDLDSGPNGGGPNGGGPGGGGPGGDGPRGR